MTTRYLAAVFFALAALSCTGEDTATLDIVSPTPTQTDTATDPGTTPTPTYTLTLNAGANGTLLPTAAGGPTYPAGTIVSVTAAPSNGYLVSAWTGTDNGGTSTTNAVTMTSDKTVSATFALIPATTYALTLNQTSGGTISAVTAPNAAGGKYTAGTAVTLLETPNGGYQLNTWTGVDTSSGTGASITMGSDKTVSASFVASGTLYTLTYYTPDIWGDLTFAATDGASNSVTGTVISASGSGGSIQYPAGTHVAITGTAHGGFKFGCFLGTTEATDEPGSSTVLVQVNHVVMNADTKVQGCFPFTSDSSGTCPESQCPAQF